MEGGHAHRARRLSGQDLSLVTEYAVTETNTVNESNSEVAGLSDGGYVVVWQGTDSNGAGIYSQKFDSNGNKTA